MTRQYGALVRKEDRTDYWVDTPGCVASGDTIEEVKTGFSEAIAFHHEEMDAADGGRLPAPSSRAAVLAVEKAPFVARRSID